MKAVHAEGHAAHAPGFFLLRGQPAPSPECPERAEHLLGALRDAGHETREPTRFGLAPVQAVHSPDYLAFLETAWSQWQSLDETGPAREVIANVHPGRRAASYPTGIVGRAGWHMADTACPLGQHTYTTALLAADVALTAAELVLDGEHAAYALCRPPGHHAFADMAGGFCFLNNSAIAAQRLRAAHERVAVIDIDVHHGNGTQGIFWQREDVLTVSVHAAPENFYPFFWGYAHERGEGAGEGRNLNLPLAAGAGDGELLDALVRAEPLLRAFSPTAIVLALGLDAALDDPLGVLRITTDGFERAARAIAQLGLPTVIVQEGGYLCDALGDNLAAALRGFEG